MTVNLLRVFVCSEPGAGGAGAAPHSQHAGPGRPLHLSQAGVHCLTCAVLAPKSHTVV